ncbi:MULTISPECIES: hypothetical protein [Lysinibacillus]|uniref:hypothetical protein n=1 Tax=Lysinibacillus TaxID=400634 RepID=UPI001C2FE5DD|nr:MULTISPECIES: hypothetical protein [Lysinibacillus]
MAEKVNVSHESIKQYRDNYETACTTPKVIEQHRSLGVMDGIIFTLNTLNIKVDGVNTNE